MVRIVTTAFRTMAAAAVNERSLAYAAAGNIPAYIASLPFEAQATGLIEALVPVFTRAAQTAATATAVTKATVTGSLNNTDQFAHQYAANQSMTLVANITEAQQATLRQQLATAFDGHLTVDQLAKQIRPVVGLHPAWAQAVETRRATMLANPDKGYSAARWQTTVDKRVATYADRLTAKRAMGIARTEIMTAENLGRFASMTGAVASGNAGADSLKEWSPGPGACPECAGLSGEQVGWDQPFSNGSYLPPAHTNCRCTVNYLPSASTAISTPAIDWLAS